jgi:hypothetical protein
MSFPLVLIASADRMVWRVGTTAAVAILIVGLPGLGGAVQGLLNPMQVGLAGSHRSRGYHNKIAVRRRSLGPANYFTRLHSE